jgi:hypothetical protein
LPGRRRTFEITPDAPARVGCGRRPVGGVPVHLREPVVERQQDVAFGGQVEADADGHDEGDDAVAPSEAQRPTREHRALADARRTRDEVVGGAVGIVEPAVELVELPHASGEGKLTIGTPDLRAEEVLDLRPERGQHVARELAHGIRRPEGRPRRGQVGDAGGVDHTTDRAFRVVVLLHPAQHADDDGPARCPHEDRRPAETSRAQPGRDLCRRQPGAPERPHRWTPPAGPRGR